MAGLGQATTVKGDSVKRWLPLIVLAAGCALFFAAGGQRYVSFEALRAHRETLFAFVASHGVVAGLVFILAYAVVIAFSLPGGAVMTVFGGFLFGPYLGLAYAVIGATIGAAVVFLAARTALGEMLHRRAGPFLHRMEAGFQENALSYLLVLRLIPVFPFWLVNLVPAFLGVPFRTYLIGTFFGIIPGTFVYALLGGGVSEVLDAGRQPDLGIIFQSDILLPLIGLAFLALLPAAYKRMRARKR
ncbi:MAG TPA: TVP38/TMEM64 family protein [Alphaproteobacteria bacterium]|nr:TVP38/TMEM64 family protein [Alphaproteobacteria bacterium]